MRNRDLMNLQRVMNQWRRQNASNRLVQGFQPSWLQALFPQMPGRLPEMAGHLPMDEMAGQLPPAPQMARQVPTMAGTQPMGEMAGQLPTMAGALPAMAGGKPRPLAGWPDEREPPPGRRGFRY